MSHLFLLSSSTLSNLSTLDIVIILVIGAISGFLAQFIVPGRGFGLLTTIGIGMLGGFLGQLLFKDYLDITKQPVFDEIICATAGSIILCIILNVILGNRQGKRGKEKDTYDWNNE